ncbi:hypothetical protein VMCG_06386 [Cytospora schulzeri]|uniref:Dihydroorotate dehydrogenase catalytic domain-containing protein n=1 Tax=Cytospora schulzeri TaxID=448051 RepID=A0A423W844_9PEZI|nr:hypothetical protein VMCG_06386 [Valsa malicola]
MIPTTEIPIWYRLGPLTRAVQSYGRAQRKRPWVTQLSTSLTIYFCADLSAQRINGRDYDPERTCRFMWLSRNFNYPSRILSIATKIVINQAIFTPVFNVYFFGMQAFMAGDNLVEISQQKELPRQSAFGFGTAALSVSLAASIYLAYLYATDTRASYHQWLVPRLIRVLYPDAEDAHHIGTQSLKVLYELGLHPRERPTRTPGIVPEPSDLAISVFDTTLANPIGISAGLDKNADVPDVLFDLGAGVVEVGGCTPRPQDGNPKPRCWRVPSVEGMVNRFGLNSRGADAMAAKLRDRVRKFAKTLGLTEHEVLNGEGTDVPPGSLLPGRLLCVQIAKQKETDERDVEAVAKDYVYCVSKLAPYADVLVVNVSSPNTPGLRDLQAAEPLGRILGAVVKEAQRAQRKMKPKVMVKVSPDEDEDAQMEGIVQAIYMSGVDGVIVGNTTKRRSGLVPEGVRLNAREQQALTETGGFSGPTMFNRTLDLVGRYRKLLDSAALKASEAPEGAPAAAAAPAVDGTVSGKVESSKAAPPPQKVIFATGGIKDGEQALKVLNAGASVAMIYTGMVYGGAGTVTRMKGEMRSALTDGKEA